MNDEAKRKFREELAQKFIHILEEKKLDWIKGWDASAGGSPYNAVTSRSYSGVNLFTLALESMVNGYGDPRWATMTQIRDEKGIYHSGEKWHLKKGSHGTKVEYCYPYDRENKKVLTWNEYKTAIDSGREQKEFVIQPKYFTVFNASQIEGIKTLLREEKERFEPDRLIEKISINMGVPIEYSTIPLAFYSPDTDRIHLPDTKLFYSAASFHGTALHELAHATGHPSRLNRDIKNGFGSEKYAAEELVAEMTSCFMAANLKDVDLAAFNRFENNEAYIQSWIQSIKDKPEALIRAVKEADRATKFMEFKAGIIPESEYKRSEDLEKISTAPQKKEEVSGEKAVEKVPEAEREINQIFQPEAIKPTQNPSQIRMHF